MGLSVVTAPVIEPITLAQAKDHLRIELTETSEDAWIAEAIGVAVDMAEDVTGRAFISRTLDWSLDGFDQAALCQVPRPPLIGVTSIKYIDTAGVEQTLSSALYKVDAVSQPGRIVPDYGQVWPSTREEINAVTVRLTAGYGSGLESVPKKAVAAMKLILGDLYKYRENVITGATVAQIPDSARDLLLSLRDWRV